MTSNKVEQKRLPLEAIRLDGETQPRAYMDMDAIDEYAEAMRGGAKFPPIVVFFDGTNYWASDGFHRHGAAEDADKKTIECEVHQGTLEDARWYSYSANQTHGMRRTPGDVRRAIEAALRHPQAEGMNHVDIAKHIGCEHSWVSRIHKELVSLDKAKDSPIRSVTRKGKSYRMNVSGMKKSKRKCSTEAVAGESVETFFEVKKDHQEIVVPSETLDSSSDARFTIAALAMTDAARSIIAYQHLKPAAVAEQIIKQKGSKSLNLVKEAYEYYGKILRSKQARC